MENKNGSRILVTGGAGYIGSAFVMRAAAAGIKVNVLDTRNPYQENQNSSMTNSQVNYFEGDIAEDSIAEQSLTGVDLVIHLAAVSDGKAGKAFPELTQETNVSALKRLVARSKKNGVAGFVFVSTMGVYGNKYHVPLTENLAVNPVDPYSESKAIGEVIVREENSDSFATISLRLAMVYGVSPFMKTDLIVNRLVFDAVTKKEITIWGGSQRRPQVHVDDVGDLFLYLYSNGLRELAGENFNVVGTNPSILEIAQIIHQKLPDVKLTLLPGRIQEDSFEMDGTKLKRALSFTPHRSLDTGIEELINYYSAAS